MSTELGGVFIFEMISDINDLMKKYYVKNITRIKKYF